jgi:hypothetical protein
MTDEELAGGGTVDPAPATGSPTYSEPVRDPEAPDGGTVDPAPTEPENTGPEHREGAVGDQGEWHESAVAATDETSDNEEST